MFFETVGILGLLFSCVGYYVVQEQRKRMQKLWDDARNFNPPNAFGRTTWATIEELRNADLLGLSGIFFGFAPDGSRRLRLSRPGNILLVAAARSGKFLTVICALVMSLPRKTGALIVDPKGEITSVCGGALLRRGRVYVINPYRVAVANMEGLVQACINPLEDLLVSSLSFISDCRALCATFWDEPADAKEPHWLESALELFAGIIYWLKKYASPAKQTLPYARKVLTGATGQSFHAWCRMVLRLNDEYLTATFSRFAARGAEESREFSSIVSTAITQTAWLDDSAVAECLCGRM